MDQSPTSPILPMVSLEALTFRNYIPRPENGAGGRTTVTSPSSSSVSASTNSSSFSQEVSSQNIATGSTVPSYQDLIALQQELLFLAEKSDERQEKLRAGIVALERTAIATTATTVSLAATTTVSGTITPSPAITAPILSPPSGSTTTSTTATTPTTAPGSGTIGALDESVSASATSNPLTSSLPTQVNSPMSNLGHSPLSNSGLATTVVDSLLPSTSSSPTGSSPSSASSSRDVGSGVNSLGSNATSTSKPTVVTLKIKRSDVQESSKTDDEQSTFNLIKVRNGSSSQDGTVKRKRRIDDYDSEISEDDKDKHGHASSSSLPLPKAKRDDFNAMTKAIRSTSPIPHKPPQSHTATPAPAPALPPPSTPAHHYQKSGTPKIPQPKTGDKAHSGTGGSNSHSGSFQKKKKNSEKTEKSQKPTPKVLEAQDDFSKVKVSNQVPIQTFWTSMEPYFRHFTESDRSYLEDKGDQLTPLLIPPLGKHYLDTWAEEERTLMPSFDGYDSRRNSVDSTKEGVQSMTAQTALSRNATISTSFELTDENIEQDEVSCGPLTERLICSLIDEQVMDPATASAAVADATASVAAGASLAASADGVSGPEDEGMNSASRPPNPRNYMELEERLKRELRYIGLLGDEEINWDAREDDEISIALRASQKELREVMKLNQYRKQKLLGIVTNRLAYQEYNTILEDLDKQLEQGYLKRFRVTKSKKKKSSTLAPKSLSENALSAMDRRRRFVQGLGPIFPPENYTTPTKTIYEEEEQDGRVEGNGEAEGAPGGSGGPRAGRHVPSYRELNGLT